MAGYRERNEFLSYPLKTKITRKYNIVEVLFGQMFRLHKSLCLEIAYGSILFKLCKLQPSTMHAVANFSNEMLQKFSKMYIAVRKMEMFTQDLDNNILDLFHQFVALRM